MNPRTPLIILITALLFVPIIASNIGTAEDEQSYATIGTNRGDIKVKLFEEDAPKTVDNFVKYAEDDFYQDTIFHRVIKGFMIQGGGFTKNLQKKETTYSPVENEAEKSGHRNKRGTITMARTSDPDSATSQFFINTEDNENLDWDKAEDGHGYCVFGEVVEGMDVVDDIESVRTGTESDMDDVPQEDIVINDVKISRDSTNDGTDGESGSENDSSNNIISSITSNLILIEIVLSVIAGAGIFYYLSRNNENK